MVLSNECLYHAPCILQVMNDNMRICKPTSGPTSFAPDTLLFLFQAIKVHVRTHSSALPLASVLRTESLRHFYIGML
jgi:hypothetical protein